MNIKKKLSTGRGIISVLLAAALLFSGGCAGQREQQEQQTFPTPLQTETVAQPEAQSLRAAVLYDGACSDGSWEDRFSRLEQSLLLDFTAQAVDVSQGYDLEEFDIVYPDVSIMDSDSAETLSAQIVAFAAAGGGVFLDNSFYGFFAPDFLGAESFEKLEGFPYELEYPELGTDLTYIQQIIEDFALLYQQFPDFSTVSQYDYGYGMHAGSAQVLVRSGELALYTMNRYGEGYVFFTNPLLPNSYAISGFSMTSRSEEQKTLSNTTASCNQLLENEFAAYVSKQKNGYALTRVFGSFTRPNMAWELHFEEITGFENGSGILFGELCKESNQVPSYTLIRNTYKWFLKAESVSFLLGQEGENFTFLPDDYENAYSSGTHVAADGVWLSLSTVDNGGSYFVDDPFYTQRAYPYAADLDGDGLTDILCGSSDGYFYFYKGLGFTDRLETEAAVPVTDASGYPLTVMSYSAPTMADIDSDGILDIVSGCGEGKIYWFSGNGDLTFEYEGLLCNANLDGQSLPDMGDLNGDGYDDLVTGSSSGQLQIWYADGQGAGTFEGATEIPVDESLGSWLSPS